MKRRVSLFVLVLAVVLASASFEFSAATGGRYLGEMRVVNCESWVSLRSEPSVNASRVTTVPLGATVEAYYYNSEFSECYYRGMHGYILSSYLSATDYLGTRYVVNCYEYVTLREWASTSAPEVTRVPLGQPVQAYYYNSEFCECTYNGYRGYILSQYLGTSPNSTYRVGEYMGVKYVDYCNSWVTLRSYASTSADTITRVSKGEPVYAYWYNSEFAECYYNGMHGYILLKYLR